MFPATPLLSILLLAVSIAASPLEVRTSGVSLSFAKRVNANGGAINLVHQDRARAAALKQRATAVQNGKLDHRDTSTVATNEHDSVYLAPIGVGSPPTTYNVIIDTGASNTFVGANRLFRKTKTSVNTGQLVALNWGNDNFTVDLWNDTVTISPDLIIPQQPICVVGKTNNLPSDADGSLGIGTGLTALVQGGLISEPDVEIPTVTHNLYLQGKIPEEVVSIFFAPALGNVTNGEVTWGGIDSSKYIGEISYVPITATFPASYYWGFNQSITYGCENKVILRNTAGITDTGTTFILLATEAYEAYQSATGATEDKHTGLLKLTNAQYEKLENLNFHIGSGTFVLTPNAQIWPRVLNSYINGYRGTIYSVIGSVGTPYGVGYDFMNGQAFLERFYSVYDSTNKRIGFANTTSTDLNIN